MNFLHIADVHVFPWFKGSVVDENGIPSRLSQYEILANDLDEYATKHNVAAIILDGDLLQAAISPPMALNMAKHFLLILSRNRPVFVIPGNHDFDSKGDNNSFHSAIMPLIDPDLTNIVYVAEEIVYEFKGIKIFFRPWKTGDDNYTNLQPADMAVLHGPIIGCRDVLGYEFRNGFDLEDLFANYRAAFVGDIHNPQVFNDTRTGNIAVIPGALVGNRFSDNLGHFALYDSTNHTVESVCIRDLPNGDKYYYFRNGAEPDPVELAKYPNTLYKPPRSVKNKAGQKSTTATPRNVITDIIYKYLSQLPIEHKPEIRDVLAGIYEKVKVDYVLPTPNRVVFRSLVAESFLSIQDPVTFEFAKEDDEILIRGANGSGKSTFPEALYWAITGELSKDIAVGSISNDYSKSTAKVVFEFSVGADTYRITRTRESGNLLRLEKNDNNISKGSAAETQTLIYDVMGFGKEEIDLMVYFSLNTENLFTSLGVNQQLEFISRLAQSEILDEIRVKFKEKIQGLNDEILVKATQAAQAGNQIERLTAKILGIQQDRDREAAKPAPMAPVHKESLSSLQDKIQVLNRNRQGFVGQKEAVNNRIAALREARLGLDKLALQDSTVATKKANVQKELAKLLERRKSVAAGKCYTCGHDLVDDSQLKAIDAEIAAQSKKAKELAVYKAQASEEMYLDNDQQTDLTKAELTPIQKGLDEIDLIIESVNSQIRAYDVKPPAVNTRDFDAEIRVLEEERDEVRKELTGYNVENLESRKAAYTAAAKLLDKTNKNPVYTDSIISAYEELLAAANVHLNKIGITVSISKNYELLVKVDSGKERPVKSLSGGEKRLIDVVMLLALGSCYQKLYGLDHPLLGLSIYDEVFVYLSQQNLHFVHGLISDAPGIKVCISNDEGLLGLFSNIISVVKDPSRGSQYKFSQ